MKDSKQGYGVAVSKTGCSYEGTWNTDLHEGYGVEVYKDGGKEGERWKGGWTVDDMH